MSNTEKQFFNYIFEDNYLKVIRFVATKSKSINDVQDIVQETFTELYLIIRKKGINYIKNPEALLIKIAKTKLYTYYTIYERLKLKFTFSSYEDKESGSFVNIVDNEIEEKFDNSLTVEEIWQIIKTKSNDIQKVFYLYYYADMTIKEIALSMRISESNVKHKIYRTLSEIRQIYKGGE